MVEQKGGKTLKKVLLTVLMIILLAGFVGCDTDEYGPEYALERNDLIMVNLSTVANLGSQGIYVFFFQDYPTRFAFPEDVHISFDSSLEKPIVRAKSFTKVGGYMKDKVTMRAVEVFFRDREQMQEYWIVGQSS